MKRILTLLFLILILFFTVGAAAVDSPARSEVKKILEKVSPSIVKVVAENHKRYVATGIAIEPDHVITTMMVIRYPHEELYVRTVKGDEYEVKVVGKDQETSLLLLKLNRKVLRPIKTAKGIEVGDWTALVGAFYKKFPSIFQGIVSSVSDDALIVNAPVVPGSAGGALVNQKGELTGVVRGRFGYTLSPDYTLRDHSTEFFIRSSRARNKDLCYAIPVSKLASVADDLKKYGRARKAWLGVSLNSRGPVRSPMVSDVAKGSPAEKAGIRKGDKLLSINGKPVRGYEDVIRVVKNFKPGQKAKFDLLRGKLKKSVIAVIGENKKGYQFEWHYEVSPGRNLVVIPEMGERLPQPENYVFSFSGSRTLGVDFMAITPGLAKKFNVKEGSGLMISRVYKNGAAEKAGLQAADIVVKAGNKIIRQNADLRLALNQLKEDEPVQIYLYRSGKLKKIKVVPGKIGNQYSGVIDRFWDKMRDIRIKIDDENRMTLQEVKRLQQDRKKLNKLRKNFNKEFKGPQPVSEPRPVSEKELTKYKREVERMKKEQEELKKQLLEMRKLIEKENKKKKKETNS